MDPKQLRAILDQLAAHEMDIDQAMEKLRDLPFADLGFARLDSHRSLRKGSGEVIFCERKTPQQVVAILQRMGQTHARVLGTRATPEMAAYVCEQMSQVRYDPIARLLVLENEPAEPAAENSPLATIVSAGTADMPVAEEAAQTLEFLGQRVQRVYDVGVAGLHRLLDVRKLLEQADVIICVAGMEGALTSVVAGLVACPVIGVPTSVGYGANFGGLSALLTMINTCAPGVAVVNIDNGFGAAQVAAAILQGIRKHVLKEENK